MMGIIVFGASAFALALLVKKLRSPFRRILPERQVPYDYLFTGKTKIEEHPEEELRR